MSASDHHDEATTLRHPPLFFAGVWRITRMSTWGPKTLDLAAPAALELSDDGLGRLQFVAVAGWLDCRYPTRGGDPVVEFTWEGHDDGRPASGRGWARVIKGGDISGEIFIHRGDDSTFTAVRTPDSIHFPNSSTNPRRRRGR
jgi:hypothetical protein